MSRENALLFRQKMVDITNHIVEIVENDKIDKYEAREIFTTLLNVLGEYMLTKVEEGEKDNE